MYALAPLVVGMLLGAAWAGLPAQPAPAPAAIAPAAASDAPRSCFRGRPMLACRSFWITEFDPSVVLFERAETRTAATRYGAVRLGAKPGTITGIAVPVIGAILFLILPDDS